MLSKSFGFVRESLIVNMRYCHTNHKTLQVIANTVQVSLSVCHVTFIIFMVSVLKFVRNCHECRERLLILDPSPSPLDLNSLEDIVSFLGWYEMKNFHLRLNISLPRWNSFWHFHTLPAAVSNKHFTLSKDEIVFTHFMYRRCIKVGESDLSLIWGGFVIFSNSFLHQFTSPSVKWRLGNQIVAL